jgi:hypothetical protein
MTQNMIFASHCVRIYLTPLSRRFRCSKYHVFIFGLSPASMSLVREPSMWNVSVGPATMRSGCASKRSFSITPASSTLALRLGP